MVAIEPEKCVDVEKVPHLVAAVIVDQRIPVLVKALARVGVFIQVRSVETGETVRIGANVAWHPVEQEADAGPMAADDERGASLAPTEAAVRRTQPTAQVTHGPTNGKLGDRR